MYIAKVTNDYDNIASTNYTDYHNKTLSNCTNNENIIEIVIPLQSYHVERHLYV